MKGLFIPISAALAVAASADFAAGSYPIAGGYNFIAGAETFAMPSTIKPNAGESTTDFSVRFTAWLQSFFDGIYGTGNVTGLVVTFADDTTNVNMTVTGNLKIVANDPLYLPNYNQTANAALSLKLDKDATHTANYQWILGSQQDEVPAPNYNSQVNNYPGSGYAARV